MARFGRSVGGEMPPVGGAPAARGYRPPRLAKPARGTSGGGLCWPASYWGARGGAGEAERPAGRVEAELVQAAGMAARRAWRRGELVEVAGADARVTWLKALNRRAPVCQA
jgi:hypothetical protein